MKNKLLKQKIAKGFASLAVVVVLLISILAGSIYYQNNNITSNVVKDASSNSDKEISTKEIGARNLNQLNEGWYKIIEGHLFYLKEFNEPVYLYMKINNPDYQNKLFSVDSNGNVEFYEN